LITFSQYKPFLEVFAAAVCGYIIHKIAFQFCEGFVSTFYHPLETLYGFFTLCSIIIIFILIQVKRKNIDSVGQTFMLLTCGKMVLCYAMLHPILKSESENMQSEKMNFFLIFALFLTIETVVTIRILNRK